MKKRENRLFRKAQIVEAVRVGGCPITITQLCRRLNLCRSPYFMSLLAELIEEGQLVTRVSVQKRGPLVTVILTPDMKHVKRPLID